MFKNRPKILDFLMIAGNLSLNFDNTITLIRIFQQSWKGFKESVFSRVSVHILPNVNILGFDIIGICW